jgi:hypothetical protein
VRHKQEEVLLCLGQLAERPFCRRRQPCRIEHRFDALVLFAEQLWHIAQPGHKLGPSVIRAPLIGQAPRGDAEQPHPHRAPARVIAGRGSHHLQKDG